MITATSGRPVIARGDFTATQVSTVALPGFSPLTVKPDEPPPRHALLLDWPPIHAEARKSYAQQLRALALPFQRT